MHSKQILLLTVLLFSTFNLSFARRSLAVKNTRRVRSTTMDEAFSFNLGPVTDTLSMQTEMVKVGW